MAVKKTTTGKITNPEVTERTSIKPSQLVITVITDDEPIPAGHTPEDIFKNKLGDLTYLFKRGGNIDPIAYKEREALATAVYGLSELGEPNRITVEYD